MNLKSIQDNNFLKSIVAGMCISIGCICYLLIENKIVGAFLFAVGILSIIVYHLNLYTGKIGLIESISDLIDCIIYLFGNMFGCGVIYFLLALTPIYLKIQEPLKIIVNNKMNIHVIGLFVLGIFCGILMLFATKFTERLILPIFCIATFILIGAEHSVADSFYLLELNNGFVYFKTIIIIALGNAVGAITVNRMIKYS